MVPMPEFENELQNYLKGKIDRNVFFQIFETEFKSKLISVLYSITPNADDIDDIYQETLMRFHQHLNTYQAGTNFTAWIIRIARNAAMDYLKDSSKRNKNKKDIPDDLKYQGPGPKTENINKEMKNLVVQALSGIPTEHRELICLRFFADLKLEEIAGITGLPLSTVRDRLEKGVMLLSKAMKSLKP